jgi:DNA-binding GntR family transcriptional regulator
MKDYMDLLVENTRFDKRKPIRQAIYESLRKSIISGIIPAGERLVEQTYAERLNISRTPVREALRMLEVEELVEYVPRVGAAIKRISKEDIIEIFEIRHNLEALAITEAMNSINKNEIREIYDLLSLTEKHNDEGNNEETIRLFGEFNSRIYETSKMIRLKGMINKLDEYFQRFRSFSMSTYDRRVQAIKEHRELLYMIGEKDKEQLNNILRRHLEHSRDAVIDRMKLEGVLK